MAGWKAGTVEGSDGLAGRIADVMEASIDGYDREAGAPALNLLAEAIIGYLLDEQLIQVSGTDSAGNTPDNITVTLQPPAP